METSKQNDCSTPVAAGKQMSQSLKDRLKRCGRYHSSPVPSKRQCTPTINAISKRKTETGPILAMPCLTPEVSRASTTQAVNNHSNTAITSIKCLSADLNKAPDLLPYPTVNVGIHNEQSRHYRTCTPVNKQVDRQVISKHTSDDVKEKSSSHCSNSPHFISSSSSSTGSTDSSTVIVRNDKCAEKSDSNMCVDQGMKKRSISGIESREARLQKELLEKQEKLRRLKMVKMYREKNNLPELEGLITKWRHVSQEALQDLYDRMPAPKPTLGEMLDHMNIEHDFIGYNAQEESFYS